VANDDTALISEADIAVVGMACRFPAATSVADYWANCRDGVESVERYDDASLREAGVASALLRNPLYVKAGAPLPGMRLFDAEFFGLGPKDAAIMDPQHRHFLECAWEALEDAGHAPSTFDGAVGVFGGCGMNAYMMFNLLSNPALMESVGLFLIRHTGNDKDFLTTRVSYNLNLTGPSINVQTACSTSLVAIHQAVQSLLGGECDLALAGGVTIEQPHRQGYDLREWRGDRRAPPAAGRHGGRRPHPRRDQGIGHQQRRVEQGRLPGAKRRWSGGRRRRGAGRRRTRRRRDQLHRMPRDGDARR
jgi:acyl transferase domain-containing protein